MNAARSIAGRVGDVLAAASPKAFGAADLEQQLQCDRSGVTTAIRAMLAAEAISGVPDALDRRRSLYFMTNAEAVAWRRTNGTHVAGITVVAPPSAKPSAPKVAAPLQFGLYADGRIIIEHLAKRPLVLSAEASAGLAATFSGFPEGALQRLCESALKPSFTLVIDDKRHALTAAQTVDLITYVESLPSRAFAAAHLRARGAAAPGTDHRTHRIAGAEDDE